MMDWCCFYYFARNSLVALLEALCARVYICIYIPTNFVAKRGFHCVEIFYLQVPEKRTDLDHTLLYILISETRKLARENTRSQRLPTSHAVKSPSLWCRCCRNRLGDRVGLPDFTQGRWTQGVGLRPTLRRRCGPPAHRSKDSEIECGPSAPTEWTVKSRWNTNFQPDNMTIHKR